MNPATFTRDLDDVIPGGAFFYADDIELKISRKDISVYPMPVNDLVQESGAPIKLKDYVANMVYVGVLAHVLGIDLEMVRLALDFHFNGKQKPIDLNFGVVQAAVEWAEENLEKTDPYRLEKMDATDGYIMADGNTASALGSIYGGVHFASWYPITPASSLAEALNTYLPKFRKDPETNKNTFAVVQAEDELAAIGMAIGAGWAGLRAMTSTSGPGLSLMTEFAGLAYFSEVPIVVWDVQRMGPSTGLPTRTSQGDINMVYFLGHGDTKNVVLIPGSVNECFEFGWKAFDLAEKLQTPVFVLSDLDLGMNQWMGEPFKYPDEPIDRGKVLWEEDIEKLTEPWGRYLDKDGDGIPYRTIPGNRSPMSSYFARGTGHDEYANYSEEPDVWERNMDRLLVKFETARSMVPGPKVNSKPDAEIGVISLGSLDPSILEAQDKMEADGLNVDYLRVRSLPFNDEIKDFIQEHKKVYVVEMNRDGQLHQLLVLEYPELSEKLVSLTKNNGLQIAASWIKNEITSEEEK